MTEKENLSPSIQVIRLFVDDLKNQTAIFHEIINTIGQKNLKEENSKKIKNVLKVLISATKIIQLNVIENFSRKIESFIEFAKDESKVPFEVYGHYLKESYDLLKNLSLVLPEDLLNYLKEHNEDFIQMASKLSNFHNDTLNNPSETKSNWIAPDKKMMELFKAEVETQIHVLSEGLLNFQRSGDDLKQLESLMRAAHSIKGAARVFSFEEIIRLAHSMEDCFVAAQHKKISLDDDKSEVLFHALDCISDVVNTSTAEIHPKMEMQSQRFNDLTNEIKSFTASVSEENVKKELPLETASKEINEEEKQELSENQERVLRVTAQNLNRLMGLAAESMVETRWLRPFCDSLQKLKLAFNEQFSQLEYLKNNIGSGHLNEATNLYFLSLRHEMHEHHNELSDRIADLEMFITRHSNLTDRLYSEVVESRMRPFADAVSAYPRMVWETARRLKKKARLEIFGKNTLIDRDILENLEAPLGHLLRNAIVHGIESPEERIAAGKMPEGIIRLEASHKGGMLSLVVSDDGRGINLNKIKQKIIDEKLIKPEMAEKLSETELLDFMYLPGFSTSEVLNDLSGRGMGLNIVQNLIQEVSGNITIDNQVGQGFSIHLLLPLTLSVMRALITKVRNGVFAFPLARIEQAITVSAEQVQRVEKREYVTFRGHNVGLVHATQVFGIQKIPPSSSILSIIIIKNKNIYYGIVVDEFLSEKELVLQDLESRLSRIPCITSGSVLENGDPVLIVDIEDSVEVIDKLLMTSSLYNIQEEELLQNEERAKKRILVVDDSISVREVECRLLRNYGYEVDSAVNGADAWNAIRLENYDMVVTDVDMPRMNGIELVKNIKKDARLKNLPVMIVSYKERENDRLLGLEAGANYYLAKSTFGDSALINAVRDLIGEP
jgi:two-component system sensor histidine kinase and response regulator WspE